MDCVKDSAVERILKFYKYIDVDIKMASEWLEQYEQGYNPLGAISYNGMPKSNNLPDCTTTLAIKLVEANAKENIDTLKKRITELQKLKWEIFNEISTLTPVHKTIVSEFYIKGSKWEYIAGQINYSVRHSKNIRHVALKDLGTRLAQNKYIVNSVIIDEIIK